MNNKGKRLAKSLVFVALFAALTAACGFISFPTPVTVVPIVLQNMMAVINGLLLGPVLGTASTVLFIVVGILGLPVFSGGTGGLVKLTGPTGGFIIGYAIASLVAGLILGRPRIDKVRPVWRIAVASVCAFVIMYVPGVIHFMRVMEKTFSETMALCVTPFIIGDTIKIIVSILVTIPLRKTVATYVFNDDVTED